MSRSVLPLLFFVVCSTQAFDFLSNQHPGFYGTATYYTKDADVNGSAMVCVLSFVKCAYFFKFSCPLVKAYWLLFRSWLFVIHWTTATATMLPRITAKITAVEMWQTKSVKSVESGARWRKSIMVGFLTKMCTWLCEYILGITFS